LIFFGFSFYGSIFSVLLADEKRAILLAGAEFMITLATLRYRTVLARNRAYSKLDAE
jgi:hypothetical protein